MRNFCFFNQRIFVNRHLSLCALLSFFYFRKNLPFRSFRVLYICPLLFLMMAAMFRAPLHCQESINLGTLLDEMTDLERLTSLPSQTYHVLQYSSYDRRSQKAGMAGWFSNSDGFGGEPLPGFQQVIEPPDKAGVGTYLIFDVQGPGAILRLWTAGINGHIRFYLDDMDKPVYEGNAEEFFWNTAAKISGIENDLTSQEIFRQFDATYFPVPFSKKCRMEWIGNIKKIHFYHVGIRIYDHNVKVESFHSEAITEYQDKILKTANTFLPIKAHSEDPSCDTDTFTLAVPGNSSKEFLQKEGSMAVHLLILKIKSQDLERALRTNILKIYFDEAETPQVYAPVGDFFGAAPGLNPYKSFPFSVYPDGRMTCRFIMPFQNAVRFEIENTLDELIEISGSAYFKNFEWKEGKSMHFRTRWKMSHELTASNSSVIDIPYAHIAGTGRIVGTAAYIYNPSPAVTSWGNWWGEGDEKIYIDDVQFPSFFGTGSEDYFNYSWSAEQYFSFPYCGQPRNDGPGNRGYVSNYRWHILDDLIFRKNISFFMELLHHGQVPNFSYGRIIYAYTLPGCFDDFQPITKRDIHSTPYLEWKPMAYLGSSGYSFVQAEDLVVHSASTEVISGKIWSGSKILLWKPMKEHEELKFVFHREKEGKTNLGMTLAHLPNGGGIMVFLNGDPVTFNDNLSIDLGDSARTYLKNYISEPLPVQKGKNEIALKFSDWKNGNVSGIDFFWLNER